MIFSGWRDALRETRTLLLVSLVQLAVTVGGVLYLSRTYYWGLRVVVLHATLVAAAMLATVLVLGATTRLRWVRESALARRILLLPVVAAAYKLAMLYVANDLSNQTWGRNLNYETVAAHAAQIAAAGHGLVPLPAWLYAGVGAGFLIVAAAGFALAPGIWRGLDWIFNPGTPRRRVALITTCAGLWITSGSYLAVVLATPHDLLPRYDPIVSFFLTVTNVHPSSQSAALAARQSAERAAYQAPPSFHRRNVIIIMIDAARADHLQVYGYDRPTTPFLARLKASGQLRLVTTALSTCSDSNCGIMSTLGSQPFRDQSLDNFKLYDVLRDQGYRLHFILGGSHRWYGLRDYYAEKPDTLFDGTNSIRHPANDDRVLFDGLDRVPASDGAPSFFQFHLMSAHGIGVVQDRFRLFNPSGYSWTAAFTRRPDAGVIINTYDNGLRQADAIIEELFAALDRKGYLSDSLVVLLGDHGEGFGEHGTGGPYFGHFRFLYQEHIAIPLMIYDPRPEPYANLAFATQLDVAPTILDRLGLPIPASWQGRSLMLPDAPRYTVHESTQHPGTQMAVFRTPGALYKLMQHRDGTEELFEVVSDPMERRNLVADEPEVAARLRAELERYRHGG